MDGSKDAMRGIPMAHQHIYTVRDPRDILGLALRMRTGRVYGIISGVY